MGLHTNQWLEGKQLQTDDAAWFCWDCDPFPPEDFPARTNAERRFQHYRAIALFLGIRGNRNRCKLPRCVEREIRERFPNADGPANAVGYQQDPEDGP